MCGHLKLVSGRHKSIVALGSLNYADLIIMFWEARGTVALRQQVGMSYVQKLKLDEQFLHHLVEGVIKKNNKKQPKVKERNLLVGFS